MRSFSHAVSLALLLGLAAVLAACGGEAGDATGAAAAGEAASLGEAAPLSRASYGEDFEDNACDYLSEDEVRSIFDIPTDAEVEVQRRSFPCAYEWQVPAPASRPEVATSPEYTAGISYVVTVAEDEEAAKKSFARLTSTETNGKSSKKALQYEVVQNVGDEAAWEATHGSLVVRAGNLVFRTVASSTYYQGDPPNGELVTEQHPEQAAEIARAVLE